jgi:hypothetical protein
MMTAAPDLERLLQTGPFHDAFRAAVRARGLPLDRLRSHLGRRGIPVGLSSLSDWQHGRSRPGAGSLPAVRALEAILGLPDGALVRLLLLDGSRRPRVGIDERAGPIGALLDDLPGARHPDLDVLSRHDKVYVDVDRRGSVVWSRTVVRARRDGVDRYVVRYFGDEGCVVDRVELSKLENCRLGEVRRHPGGVMVAELLFDTVLRAGDTWVFEERLVDETGEPCREYAHGFARPAEHYTLEVRFDAAALPVDCHTFAQPGLAEPRHRTGAVALNRHHAAHLYAAGVSAGLLGIAWSWPGDR